MTPHPLLAAAATLLAAYGLGSAIAGRSSSREVTLASGCALLSLIIFALMMRQSATVPALIALHVCCFFGLLRRPRNPAPLDRPPRLVALLLLVFGAIALLNALSPEIEADANIYHLKPASDALRTGGFSKEISFYERLPHATELLYTGPFILAGSPGARLIHLALLMATLPLIVRLGLAFGVTATASWCAAALYFAAPVVLVSSASAFNDAALTFAACASIAVLITSGPVAIGGLLAGFCYGIKMTGGIVIPVGILWLVYKRRFRDVPVFLLFAMLSAGPWLIRNLLETGNPLAPLGNGFFPNPWFHILTEQRLSAALRSYDVSFLERFGDLLWGRHLQGIIGPAFLLAPLGLLALRKRSTAPLVCLAFALSVPWWLNAGARFLMLSLPFLSLALASVLPVRMLPVLVLLHGISVWPGVIDLYAPNSWHLHHLPWRVALNLESRHEYLWRTNRDYHWAKQVEEGTGTEDRILDLYGIHAAHTQRDVRGRWQSAVSENAVTALEFARQPGEEKLVALTASVPHQAIQALRLRQNGKDPGPWSLVEIELFSNQSPLPPSLTWTLDADPNRWETPLALDRNLATRWQSWQPSQPSQFVTVDLAQPLQLDQIRILTTAWDSGNRNLGVEVQQAGDSWTALPVDRTLIGPLNLRAEAIRYVKSLGFTHIVTKIGDDGMGVLGRSLMDDAPEWHVQFVSENQSMYLLKLL
ncbi:MAG: discoidin domain-containing protein [Bryobacteraceae bacterium]|nr:discoidin domain-containing protein [Bryobacteraceae bacterium]